MENQFERNEQAIAAGQGYQVNDPKAPVVQGNQNIVNVYQAVVPPVESTGSGTPQNLP